ncbi:DEAD/DEAH box helicase family protein [Candidatus Gracilibacteria bacterium]|nr:DEAD/DEAH box helicase family protein [Candidatus Gracilibacteria bacterium]
MARPACTAGSALACSPTTWGGSPARRYDRRLTTGTRPKADLVGAKRGLAQTWFMASSSVLHRKLVLGCIRRRCDVHATHFRSFALFHRHSTGQTSVRYAHVYCVRGVNKSPLVKDNFGGLIGSALSLVLRDTLICIDDLERKGGDLELKDVIGLASSLKEQRQCKVVFIVNDGSLSTEEQESYQRHGEKVVDFEFKFAPTPLEAFQYIVQPNHQTLDVADEEGTANFLAEHYPENFFTHIIIDECHRSAWGKWSEVLSRNPAAVQIGLTATPRQLKVKEHSPEARVDAQISADNIKHFGEPVYEYSIGQGIEDGYLAACEIRQSHVSLDGGGRTACRCKGPQSGGCDHWPAD